jgi:hypothetical protein
LESGFPKGGASLKLDANITIDQKHSGSAIIGIFEKQKHGFDSHIERSYIFTTGYPLFFRKTCCRRSGPHTDMCWSRTTINNPVVNKIDNLSKIFRKIPKPDEKLIYSFE